MKFNSPFDQYLYEGAAMSGAVTGDGDVEAPTGWFAPITLRPAGFIDDDGMERAAERHYGTRWLILAESNEGFVTVLTFETDKERDLRVLELGLAYSLWVAGIQPHQTREAIDAYIQTIYYTNALDENVDRPSMQLEDQRRCTHEVQEFLAGNAELISEFMQATGYPYAQIGIDFWLSRNDLAANFSTRGGGVAGEMLHDAARAHGALDVTLVDGVIHLNERPMVGQNGAQR